jgi:hypothetical protein
MKKNPGKEANRGKSTFMNFQNVYNKRNVFDAMQKDERLLNLPTTFFLGS